MYTEDDENVVVNDNESNDNYSDFYTSFMNNEKNDKKDNKSNKKKKKTSKKKTNDEEYALDDDVDELSDEEDYKEFYGSKEKKVKEKKSHKKTIILIILGLLFVAAVVLSIIFLGKPREKPDIVLTNEEITINVGETDVISYKIINTNKNVTSTFTSMNNDIAIVNNNGTVIGITGGETEVVIKYIIDGKENEKKCKITVVGEGSVNKNITLDVKMENGSDDVWTKKDVSITATAQSVFGINSLAYAINCENNNCEFNDLKDNKITISNNGITKVLIVAVDGNNQQTERLVTVKIDKESPTITFGEKTNITADKEINVCATCNDNISGCKQEKVCKKFTESKSNQKIVVEDYAGNQASSPSFNVKINKSSASKTSTPTTPKPTDGPSCSLSVSSDGVVTATVSKDLVYYGFNPAYSGSNTKSTKVEIDAYNKSEQKAKVVYYYVKDKSGKTSSCSLTVIKECFCTDKNNKSANCPVTCTFRAS